MQHNTERMIRTPTLDLLDSKKKSLMDPPMLRPRGLPRVQLQTQRSSVAERCHHLDDPDSPNSAFFLVHPASVLAERTPPPTVPRRKLFKSVPTMQGTKLRGETAAARRAIATTAKEAKLTSPQSTVIPTLNDPGHRYKLRQRVSSRSSDWTTTGAGYTPYSSYLGLALTIPAGIFMPDPNELSL